MRRLAESLGAALLGAAVGLLAAVVHRGGGAARPWGLSLAVAASVAVSAGLATLGAGRGVLVGYAAGWCAAVLVVVAGRPEGDYLVAADPLGWGFLVGAFAVVMVVTIVGVLRGGGDRRTGR